MPRQIGTGGKCPVTHAGPCRKSGRNISAIARCHMPTIQATNYKLCRPDNSPTNARIFQESHILKSITKRIELRTKVNQENVGRELYKYSQNTRSHNR